MPVLVGTTSFAFNLKIDEKGNVKIMKLMEYYGKLCNIDVLI